MNTPTPPPAPAGLRDQMPRIITGLILAAALISCLILGGAFLAIALALVSGLALYEFYQLFWPGKTRLCSKAAGIFLGLLLFCPVGGYGAVVVILALGFAWAALSFLMDYGRGNDAARLENHAVLPLGLLYIPAILRLALSLSTQEQFLVVVIAVASDIAAYYVGCTFGKHKIWPRVSPKKSWEGCLGGLLAGTLAAVGIACLPYGGKLLLGGNVFLWIAIGIILTLAAQFGDFFESALKRACHVKDSSAILPGHGGVLDRIDSIVFTLAAYAAVMLLVEHCAGLARFFAAA